MFADATIVALPGMTGVHARGPGRAAVGVPRSAGRGRIRDMSDYPNHPATGYGYPPPRLSDPRSPGRRAAALLWILGGLATVCGGALLGVAAVPVEKFPGEMRQAVQQMEQQFGVSWQQAMKWEGVVTGGGGVLAVLLGFGVWRSRRVPIVVALVLAGLAIVRQAIGLAATLASSGAGPELVGASCVSGVILAVLGLLVAWLWRAFREAPLVRAMQQAATPGYGYAPPGYGYPAPGYGYSPPGGTPPPPPPQRNW